MAPFSNLCARWRGLSQKWRLLATWGGALLGVVLVWQLTLLLRTPQALVRRAGQARPERAARLYARLAQEMPELTEYFRLWSAQAGMSSLDAVQELQAISAYRPNSPAAFDSHLTLARYYAGLEADQAVDEYRAALALDDRADLRVELARHLEARGDLAGAYEQYRAALGKTRIDAFSDMRRTASDPLLVARDLYDRYFFTDVVDVLRDDQRCEAHCLRAKALSALGLEAEAQAAQEACEACQNPAATPVEAPAPAARPAGPEPTIATRLPVGSTSGAGISISSGWANAQSATKRFKRIMLIGSSTCPREQASSHL